MTDDGIGADVLGSSNLLYVNAANDAPTISGLPPNNTLGFDTNVRPFRRMLVSNVDPSKSITTTIVLDKPLKWRFTTESLATSGFVRVARWRFPFNDTLDTGVVNRVRFSITAADVGGLMATNNVTTVTLR